MTRALSLSAKTQAGVPSLLEAIHGLLPATNSDEPGLVISNARHHSALQKCREHLGASTALLAQSGPLELVAFELQEAGVALDDILGRTDNDAILGRIFSRFCVGK